MTTVERSPFFNFGATSMRVVSRTTRLSLAHLRVVGDIGGDFTADTTEVSGGALNFPWAIAITGFKGSLKVNAKEYDPDTQAIMSGGVVTNPTPVANGEVTDQANVTGTTLLSATGFLPPTITVADILNVKGGWYLAKAASTTTFNVYSINMAMLSRGLAALPVDKTGLVTPTPLTIPTTAGEAVLIVALGLTFTRGATAISVTSGDSFIFYVKPTFVEASKVIYGSATSSFDNVAVFLESERDGGMTTFAILYNCKCLGAPVPFKRKGYAEYDYSIMPQYDATLDAVGEIRTIRETW
jgi:hypothetical protein